MTSYFKNCGKINNFKSLKNLKLYEATSLSLLEAPSVVVI